MFLLPGMGIAPTNALDQFLQLIEHPAEVTSLTLSQQQVMAWALRMGVPVYLGTCDSLQGTVPSALAIEPQEGDAELKVLVDLAAAGDPNASTLSTEGVVAIDAIPPGSTLTETMLGGVFGLSQPIVHDSSCPGNYVMGTVVNGEGAPMAGVRLALRDTWGNQTFAVSKDGQWDYGMFDFPIYGDGPQNLELSVVDENNNPRGAPVIVPHKIDAASDTPCHHVVIRGD